MDSEPGVSQSGSDIAGEEATAGLRETCTGGLEDIAVAVYVMNTFFELPPGLSNA